LAKPALKWPSLFADIIFETFPYALPQLAVTSIPAAAVLIGFFKMQETLPPRRKTGQQRMRAQLVELVTPRKYQFAMLCNFAVIGMQGSVWVLGGSLRKLDGWLF
jgi:hypothetical protein